MKGRKQATDGFEPVEPFTVEGDYSGKRRTSRRGRLTDELDMLAVAEIVEKDVFVIIADAVGGIDRWLQLGVEG